jgi:endogenous inhibitor of DNA gyrase (YacG/DUF329 family)
MPTLYIKCPTTGKPVSTGMSVPLNFDKKGLSQNSVQCPHCHIMHTWDGPQAFFLEEKGK